MADEHMCQWCKKYSNCQERKEVEQDGEIAIDCEVFEEADV